MQLLVSTALGSMMQLTKSALALVCGTVLLLSAAGDRAEAGTRKATGNMAPATWTAQGKASKPDHSSQDPASSPGGVKVSGGTRNMVGLPRCPRYPRSPCYHPWGSQPGQKIRDHRGPPVVPKEDPRQKW
jgi:hypothetical protein